jgi:hypothetical protein
MTPLLLTSATLLVAGLTATVHFILSAGDGILARSIRSYEVRLERHTAFLLFRYRGRDIARVQLLAVSAGLVLLFATQHPAFAGLVLLLASVPPQSYGSAISPGSRSWSTSSMPGCSCWRTHSRRLLRLEKR